MLLATKYTVLCVFGNMASLFPTNSVRYFRLMQVMCYFVTTIYPPLVNAVTYCSAEIALNLVKGL